MFASLVGRSRPTWAGLHTCSHLPTPLTADLSDVSVFGEWLSFEAAFSLDVWCETTPEGTLRALWSKFITSFMTRWPPTSDWPPPSHHEFCITMVLRDFLACFCLRILQQYLHFVHEESSSAVSQRGALRLRPRLNFKSCSDHKESENLTVLPTQV